VPEKGVYTEATQLVGKNVVTSFTALSAAFFAKLEGITDSRNSKQRSNMWVAALRRPVH